MNTNSPSRAIEKRNALLAEKKIDAKTIQKAWLTLAHMLLSEDALVADIGCGEGDVTYAMAVLYPQVRFVGIDQDKRKINKAKITYKLPNLSFDHANAATQFTKSNTFDAIVNSHVLHEIYSSERYNEHAVRKTLEHHFTMLKNNGLMFIRDFARPPPEEFILIELPDTQSTGKNLHELSEADLLIWYAEHARPRNDAAASGFFLDELPQRTPGTRLFRLPHKWAYEFIMRKDDRKNWEKELPIEYTFFTQQQFRKEIRELGARASYTAPHWDEEYINTHFRDSFKLYTDQGKAKGYPATSFISVSRKMAERKSLLIHERRPSFKEESALKITAMRNNSTGEIVDIVSRDEQISECIPYRIDPNTGRLKIYLHDGVPRSITNAVPRNGISLDDRRWSGHMLEPIAIPKDRIPPEDEIDNETTAKFVQDFLGLYAAKNKTLKKGPDFFPAPDFIDEKINSYYVQVNKAQGNIPPRAALMGDEKFHEKGYIRELDAQQVLDAITVGKVPNARLELQILYLFNHLNVPVENWSQKLLTWKIGEIKQKTSLRDLMDDNCSDPQMYKDIKGSAGQLRPVHSIFVEEGQAKGSTTGLSSKDLDFVVHNEDTINTAVVLPLSKGPKKDMHAGFQLKQMPVPQRHSGNANIIDAPSFNLPDSVTNVKLAKDYIAEQFGVLPEMVVKMGESYFSHIGMTQQKIHPFAIIVPEGKLKYAETKFLPFYQLMLLKKSLSKSTHFMIVLARAYQYFNEDMQLDFKRRVAPLVKERFEQAKPEWSLPMTFEPSPIQKSAPKHIETPETDKKTKEKQQHKKKIIQTETPRKNEKSLQKEPPQISKDTDIQLSDDFANEFEQFIEALEADKPSFDLDR